MSATIDMDGSRLIVTLRGLDVLWAARRHIVVPLEHVRDAHIDPDLAERGPWLGAGRTGALLDYAVAAGPMLVGGHHEFWDVHDPDRAVSIDLTGERYDRLVLEVDRPAEAVERINAAAARSRQHAA
jgi:hypothetical protein